MAGRGQKRPCEFPGGEASSSRSPPSGVGKCLPTEVSGDSGAEEDERPTTVLLFGKAGDGKSTVGNMLLGGQVSGFFTGNESPSKQISEDKQWTVVDSVGLFSPRATFSDVQVTDTLRQFLLAECPTLDVICYVKRATNFTGADEICLNHFRRLFKGVQLQRNVLLVFTSCPDQITFLRWNDQLISKHMGPEYKVRVGVEFPPKDGNAEIEEMMREKRRLSLEDLEKQLKLVVTQSLGPVILETAEPSSCYNTLNHFLPSDTDYLKLKLSESDSQELFRDL